MQLLLDLRATRFRFNGDAGKFVFRLFNALENELLVGPNVPSQIDIRHAAAQLADNFILSEFLSLRQ